MICWKQSLLVEEIQSLDNMRLKKPPISRGWHKCRDKLRLERAGIPTCSNSCHLHCAATFRVMSGNGQWLPRPDRQHRAIVYAKHYPIRPHRCFRAFAHLQVFHRETADPPIPEEMSRREAINQEVRQSILLSPDCPSLLPQL
jgi:hypothetical protein